MSPPISICIVKKSKFSYECGCLVDKNEEGTTCCIIFIYERSSHKNAQFAYQKNYIQQQKLNNVVHNYTTLCYFSVSRTRVDFVCVAEVSGWSMRK